MSERSDKHAADLLGRGYEEVGALGGMAVGARVRHLSEQWPSAYANGTGAIERIFHKHGRNDIEIIVKRDEPKFGPDDTHAFLADYHVQIIP